MINLNAGYNKFDYSNPILIPKGAILHLRLDSAVIAVDNSDDINYSDYQKLATNSLRKINQNKNSRFYISAKIDIGYYEQTIKLSHIYPFIYSYNMTTVLANSTYSYKSVISFSEGNTFFISGNYYIFDHFNKLKIIIIQWEILSTLTILIRIKYVSFFFEIRLDFFFSF